MASPTQLADRMVQISDLVLRLGQVRRATMHPDGEHESDTTHTLMVALCAWDMARGTSLDGELVLMFALVHDLVEAHSGDWNTSRVLSKDDRAAKEAAEAVGLERIWKDLWWGRYVNADAGKARKDIGSRWIPETIEAYERQDTDEAQLVHFVDKMMPRTTGIVGGGRHVTANGMSLVELVVENARQAEGLQAKHPQLPQCLDVYRELNARLEAVVVDEVVDG